MSAYLVIDDAEPAFLSSNKGWGDTCRWLDSLDAGEYPDAVHLREHGWTEPADALRDQLTAAVKASPPDEDTASVIGDLLGLIDGEKDDAVVSVTA